MPDKIKKSTLFNTTIAGQGWVTRHKVLSHVVLNLTHLQAAVESLIHILLFPDADLVIMQLSFHFLSLPKTAQQSSHSVGAQICKSRVGTGNTQQEKSPRYHFQALNYQPTAVGFYSDGSDWHYHLVTTMISLSRTRFQSVCRLLQFAEVTEKRAFFPLRKASFPNEPVKLPTLQWSDEHQSYTNSHSFASTDKTTTSGSKQKSILEMRAAAF